MDSPEARLHGLSAQHLCDWGGADGSGRAGCVGGEFGPGTRQAGPRPGTGSGRGQTHAEGHSSPEGTRAPSGTQPGPLKEPEGGPGGRTQRRTGRKKQMRRQTQKPGCSPGAPHHPHAGGPDADLTPGGRRPWAPPVPPPLDPGRVSFLLGRSPLLPQDARGAAAGTPGVRCRHRPVLLILSPARPPLPRPLLPGAPQDKPAAALVPDTQQRAGEGWRGASHCPTGDLSPGAHPHPRPQLGRMG